MASVYFYAPDNAEHEIRKAYHSVIEAEVFRLRGRIVISEVNADDVLNVYRHAFRCYEESNRLAAERWARTAKHLARALLHEAKVSFLEPRADDLPVLDGASAEELGLSHSVESVADLLTSVRQRVPVSAEGSETSEKMRRYLGQAEHHLMEVETGGVENELLRAERVLVAYEYGRVLECMILAYEAESHLKSAA